jgi:hypothetical protein
MYGDVTYGDVTSLHHFSSVFPREIVFWKNFERKKEVFPES